MSLTHNILIDQVRFERASSDLAKLCNDLTALQNKINLMLDILMKGFDTPAGKKFHKLCKDGLIEPMEKQRIALDHVSSNLSLARTEYQSVFSAYQDLNNSIQF
jgi:hypothetical protein